MTFSTPPSSPRPTRDQPRQRPAARAGALMGAVLAAILLAGCGSTTGAGAPASAAASSSAGAGSGPTVASVTVKTLNGSSLTLPAGKPTVIDFFTASCGPCAAGVKNVAAGLARAAPGAQAVTVDLDPSEPTEVLNQFIASVGNPPVTLVRDDGTLLKHFNVDSLGTTVVLNSSGKEIYRGVDPSADETAKALAAAGS
ncbi:TlpA family protein disulfide reductase [Pseudarthrobacter albicanus]|uniref:TlpA family protein disulfide reductase n=1 Tax=Pseudarthrobacter albicanus TaxID=2823873 RepID=UPI001BAAF170|nr:TlpA disulfide reductase family protein [Pseudarthrobacter albicanus]